MKNNFFNFLFILIIIFSVVAQVDCFYCFTDLVELSAESEYEDMIEASDEKFSKLACTVIDTNQLIPCFFTLCSRSANTVFNIQTHDVCLSSEFNHSPPAIQA